MTAPISGHHDLAATPGQFPTTDCGRMFPNDDDHTINKAAAISAVWVNAFGKLPIWRA